MIDCHTFVICAYGQSPYLRQCMESLKKQSVPSKIILVTSTDNQYIRELASAYTIPVYVNPEGGLGSDWNFGLAMAKTQYVTLAHQDDVYAKAYLEEIMAGFKAAQGDGIIAFSNYREIRDNRVVSPNTNLRIKNKMLMPLSRFPRNKRVRRWVLSMGNPICCPAVTYNKEKLGEFTFDVTMDTNIDWLAWMQLAKYEGAFAYINRPLMCHRIHEESATSATIENDKRYEEDQQMLEQFWPKPMAKAIHVFYKASEKGNQNS